jgi:hypothetical protein
MNGPVPAQLAVHAPGHGVLAWANVLDVVKPSTSSQVVEIESPGLQPVWLPLRVNALEIASKVASRILVCTLGAQWVLPGVHAALVPAVLRTTSGMIAVHSLVVPLTFMPPPDVTVAGTICQMSAIPFPATEIAVPGQ